MFVSIEGRFRIGKTKLLERLLINYCECKEVTANDGIAEIRDQFRVHHLHNIPNIAFITYDFNDDGGHTYQSYVERIRYIKACLSRTNERLYRKDIIISDRSLFSLQAYIITDHELGFLSDSEKDNLLNEITEQYNHHAILFLPEMTDKKTGSIIVNNNDDDILEKNLLKVWVSKNTKTYNLIVMREYAKDTDSKELFNTILLQYLKNY